MAQIPLCRETAKLGKKINIRHAAPGLRLDRYAASFLDEGKKLQKTVQKPTLEALVEATNSTTAAPWREEFPSLRERYEAVLREHGIVGFAATTLGPLTLHLSRASALENAGICLHPLYGFVYLPGSGLKGLSRAFAETVWFPQQYKAAADGIEPEDDIQKQKAVAAWRTIEALFGYAPHSDKDKSWKPKAISHRDKHDNAASGRIVFFDAWPESWPKLAVDILNCHHRDYYGADKDHVPPPGDWENPVPVYFAAVQSKTPFRFYLAPRRDDSATYQAAGGSPVDLLELAQTFLIGGLTLLGAGAKTNTGYGRFHKVQPLDDGGRSQTLTPIAQEKSQTTITAAECSGTLHSLQVKLELITPAFLGGAYQAQIDNDPETARRAKNSCELRPATLRGLLRWWWRIMHAEALSPQQLRQLEATIWGDTKQGGAVRIHLKPLNSQQTKIYRHKDGFDIDNQFRRTHSLVNKPDKKTTPGMLYLSYGMDEKSHGQRQSRVYLENPAAWLLELSARDAWFPPGEKQEDQQRIPAADILNQAAAALWLLCRFGGVGSKCRKGFGSIDLKDAVGILNDFDNNERTLIVLAGQFRQSVGLSRNGQNNQTAKLTDRLTEKFTVPWTDPWKVLDEVGYAYQRFAQTLKHNQNKQALGLPRKIHGSRGEKPIWLYANDVHDSNADRQKLRYASPVHIHVSPAETGYTVRVTAFPSPHLPDLKTCRETLQEFLGVFSEHLKNAAKQTWSPGSPAGGTGTSRLPDKSGLPDVGSLVRAKYLSEKTKKKGWKAEHVDTGITGPIINSDKVPADAQAGQEVELFVKNRSQKEIGFEYPTDEVRARWEKQRQKQAKKKGSRRSKGHRRV